MGIDPRRLRFGDFELDIKAGRLLRDGRTVKIQPQPLRLLTVLAERRGEVVLREELRDLVWGSATFVEFDQGLNYCIRQIRLALGDDAVSPAYLETVKKRGYRFVATVSDVSRDIVVQSDAPAPPVAVIAPPESRRGSRWLLAPAFVLVAAAAGAWLFPLTRPRRPPRDAVSVIGQITDFADSAVAPVLSPDGRMIAFIRGRGDFVNPDQVYVKMLPDGETKQLTNDPRPKYGPAFSADGSAIAYTVMEHSRWSTYAVPVLGGEPHLVLANAAGLSWLGEHQLLFSRIDVGAHMVVVTAAPDGSGLRTLYSPVHERAMAHYSYPSPDGRAALVVEMDKDGGWDACRLISLGSEFLSRSVGPAGCHTAAWSPDGRWMYFAASPGPPDGPQHLWRQRLAGGAPEQITFGPMEESGIAMDRDGTSLVTSIGMHESTLWIHDVAGDRQLSSEGKVVDAAPLTGDGEWLYYLRVLESAGPQRELYRVSTRTRRNSPMLPGVSMLEYDVSPDDTRVVYTTSRVDGSTQLWLAALDRTSPPRAIGVSGESSPHFGPDGTIVFRFTEGKSNYLGRMKEDGSERSKAVPYPVNDIQGISPGGHWVVGVVPLADNSTVAPMAIPLSGGAPVRICEDRCQLTWSTDGWVLFVSIEPPSLSGPGRSIAIPVGPDETLPPLPALGITPSSHGGDVPGATLVPRGGLIAGTSPATFVYGQQSVHRNLYRIALP